MPITDDSKLKEWLEDGDSIIDILRIWFDKQEFKYIFAILYFMEEKPNVDIIEYISLSSQNLYSFAKAGTYSKIHVDRWGGRDGLIEIMKRNNLYPDSEFSYAELLVYWDLMVVYTAEKFLRLIISIARKHSELCSSIVEPLSMHDSEYVRLIYCCNLEDYSKFLNDTSPRVAKVARIRQQFEEKWESLSDEDSEKQRIMFLKNAHENKRISILDNAVKIDGHDDWIIATLGGPLLSSGHIDDFDKDIVYNIPDNRILADYLNELIKEGKISFKDGMMPECFHERQL